MVFINSLPGEDPKTAVAAGVVGKWANADDGRYYVGYHVLGKFAQAQLAGVTMDISRVTGKAVLSSDDGEKFDLEENRLDAVTQQIPSKFRMAGSPNPYLPPHTNPDPNPIPDPSPNPSPNLNPNPSPSTIHMG